MKTTRQKRQDLREMAGQALVIRLNRKPLDPNELTGYVVGVSDLLVLLHLVDGNTLQLNGYSAIRVADIRGYRIDKTFVPRALHLLNRTPVIPTDIELSNWPALLSSANARYPLICIECERIDPDSCFIGRIQDLTGTELSLQELSPQARWDKERSYKLADITKVNFGDGYTETLACLAAQEVPTADLVERLSAECEKESIDRRGQAG